jgi:hypothetical protein
MLPAHRRILSLGLLAAGVVGVGIAAAGRARREAMEEHPSPFVRRVLQWPDTRWTEHVAPHLHVHAPLASRASYQAPALAAAAESARANNLRLLGATDYAPRLEVLVVESREAMRPFLGSTPGGWAETAQSAVLVVAGDSARAPLRHELMHVLSWQLWGPPSGHWVSEGLAMHAVGRCNGRELHTMAAALAAAGRLVPLAELPRRFDVAGEQGAAMYVQAGSFVRHVVETYGIARLRAFWPHGMRSAPRTLGVDLATLERGWRARLSEERDPAPWREMWEGVRREGCE